jgi:hypothetical protein
MRAIFLILLATLPLSLAGCQQPPKKVAGITPQTMMVRVARQAQQCWFKQNDPAFAQFSMATELNSHAGRPRVLIVPKSNPAGLPKLVIQAERNVGITGVATFGPLLDTKDGARIQESISKWAGGSSSC